MQNSKPVILFDIDDTLFNTSLFKQSGLSEYKLYEEVILALKNLSTFATLGIFSKGKKQFQKSKLKNTEMLKFFKDENIHIFEDKNINLTQVVNKYTGLKIFLVDDILEVLHCAKKITKQIFVIWIKRGRYAENQKQISEFSPDAKVDNLSEIVRIVRSNL